MISIAINNMLLQWMLGNRHLTQISIAKMLAAAFALLAVAAATDYGSLVPKIHSTVKDAVNTVSLHHDGSHFRRSSDPPMPSIPSEFNVSVALIMSFDFGAGPMSYSLSQKVVRYYNIPIVMAAIVDAHRYVDRH